MTPVAGLDMRRVLLLIVVLGAIGLIAELLLIGHFEEWTQWLPLAVLAAVPVVAAALWFRPGLVTVQLFRALMVVAAVTGLAGVVLHFTGNRAFELEMDGSLGGWPLVWHSLRGATPALAPGAMVQLGLVGLVLTWRHPAMTDTRREGRT